MGDKGGGEEDNPGEQPEGQPTACTDENGAIWRQIDGTQRQYISERRAKSSAWRGKGGERKRLGKGGKTGGGDDEPGMKRTRG